MHNIYNCKYYEKNKLMELGLSICDSIDKNCVIPKNDSQLWYTRTRRQTHTDCIRRKVYQRFWRETL